jgi:hypothetical protein
MLTIEILCAFERRIAAKEPLPNAHCDDVHAIRAYKKTHAALAQAAQIAVLESYFDAEFEGLERHE